MSYSKNSWSTGDTITATKLNHLEQGVYDTDAAADAAGPLLVPFAVTVDGEGNMSASTEADYAAVLAQAVAGRTVIADVTIPGGMTLRVPCWGFNDTDLFFSLQMMPNSTAETAEYYSVYWSAVRVLFVPHTVALS